MNSPYRANKYTPPNITLLKGSIISRLKTQFWRVIFSIFRTKYSQLKIAESVLQGLPSDAFNCDDCGQKNCVCVEDISNV